MDAIWFLVLALGLIVVGTIVVAWRSREPSSEDSAIHSFRNSMKALSPEARRATDARLRPLHRDRGSTSRSTRPE